MCQYMGNALNQGTANIKCHTSIEYYYRVAVLVIWALHVQQTGTRDYSLLGPSWTLSLILMKTSYYEWGN